MTWPELILAALNAFQAIAIAWIASRQQQVKHDLEAHNGAQAEAIRELRAELQEAEAFRQPGGRE